MTLDPHAVGSGRREGALAPLPVYGDDQILTFAEWCGLNRLSPRTARRILKRPGAPVVTQLSTTRIGITVRNNRLWQASRARR
jgi:hypothetical protein